ncbi:MAG TPA: phosphoenolpyruvate hydrolase family protein [Planctomicrobium sp.]|nr:phosphoenolpyruvate hydrolase family protein [Planctomicrobium sp.]
MLFPVQQRPLIAVAAGSGQVAKAAVTAGADFLLVLNAGRYRNLGSGSLASFLPYGNANAQTLELLRDIVPVASATPVVAGVLGIDPTRPPRTHLEELKRLGVQGITNWPSLGFVDGRFRLALETDGFTAESEIQTLLEARELGLKTIAFVHSEQDAAQFAPHSDGMILNVGLTHELDVRQDRRDQFQTTISKLNAMQKAARGENPNLFCLMFGGMVTTSEDFETVLVRCDIDGFAGGSVFERLPVHRAIESTVRQFKSVSVHSSRNETDSDHGPLIGRSPPMRALREHIGRVARFDINVCIEGETGTGKELVASEIHRLSPRREAPFITLNCGAITDSLLESELFGYEKGAFTGAERRHIGKFELADGGTLFLDEVADLTPRAQVALLRAIQQGEVLRVGGEKPIHVDVRIITATHYDLKKRVEEGLFRADLYFRLNQMPLRVPRLIDRIEDLPALINVILGRLETRVGRRLTGVAPAFEQRLLSHSWPGNIRELEYVLCRAAILEDGDLLHGTAFDFVPVHQSTSLPSSEPMMAMNRHEMAMNAIRLAGGNKSLAANQLGISRKTLYAWMQREMK